MMCSTEHISTHTSAVHHVVACVMIWCSVQYREQHTTKYMDTTKHGYIMLHGVLLCYT